MLYFEYYYKFRTILYSTKLWIHAQRKGAVTQSHASDGEGQAFIGANGHWKWVSLRVMFGLTLAFSSLF